MLLGRISAHRVVSHCDYSFGFSPITYSRFKFGCLKASEEMGRDLAEAFAKYDRIYNIVDYDRQVVVAASAYGTVPVASVQLKDCFVRTLDKDLAWMGSHPIEEIKVSRSGSHPQDYGKLTLEERRELISSDVFTISDNLTGKLVLFLDDIRVTGTHEAILQHAIDRCGQEFDYMFLYYAEVNPGVDCRIEDTLNMYHINSLDSLANMIDRGDIVINVRMTKFILRSDPTSVEVFLRSRTSDFIEEFKRAALSERYYKVPGYRRNIQTLNKISNELRSKKTVGA